MVGASVVLAAGIGCSDAGRGTGDDSAPYQRSRTTAFETDHEFAEQPVWRVGLLGAAYYHSLPRGDEPPDGDIPPGTEVEVREQSGAYRLVEWAGHEGWVEDQALQEIRPKPRKVHQIPMH